MQASHYVSASALANRLRCTPEQSGGSQARVHTSVLALLGGLRLLGEAGVQPRGRLRVVTAEHKERASERKRRAIKTAGTAGCLQTTNPLVNIQLSPAHAGSEVAFTEARGLEKKKYAGAKCEARQSCLYSYVLNNRGCAIGRKSTTACRCL